MYTTTSNGNSAQLIGLMLIGGPTLVFSGLRKLNEKRLLENTPRSKVRSAAMGLVELAGVAQPVKAPVPAPVSRLPSCWWHCRVQELRSNGKSSSWVTIHEADSNTMLYLQDDTGRVLVHPISAELHVLNNTQDLNASTRTNLAPVLNGWGLNDMNWFGGEKRMRLIEEVILDGSPLFVLGDLVSLAEPPQAREERFRAYLESVKKDPARMGEADVNKDGTVDADAEWDAFRQKLREEFVQKDTEQQAKNESEIHQLVQAPVRGNYVIATESPEELEKSLQWLAPVSMLGGIAASALGAWLAILSGWAVWIIVGCVGVGFVVSAFFKSKGDLSWRLW